MPNSYTIENGNLIQNIEVDPPHVLTKEFLENICKKVFDKQRLVTFNGDFMTIPKYLETLLENKMGNSFEKFFKKRLFLGHIKDLTPKTKRIIDEIKTGTIPDEMKVHIPDMDYYGHSIDLDFSKLELTLCYIDRKNKKNQLKKITYLFDILQIPFGVSII